MLFWLLIVQVFRTAADFSSVAPLIDDVMEASGTMPTEPINDKHSYRLNGVTVGGGGDGVLAASVAELSVSAEINNRSIIDAGVSGGDPQEPKTVSKRAAEYYNGVVDNSFYWTFSVSQPSFPPNAVLAMGRPLQRGGKLPSTEYVVLWSPRGSAPCWGTVYMDDHLNVDGTFITNGQIANLSSPAMQSAPIRLLQYVGTPQSNNFKFKWVLARDVDPSTVISQKQAGLCSSRVAPAVFQDGDYEFLGEADIDNRVMRYIYQGHVNVVEKAHFLGNVYLLTKQRCSCSCD